MGANTSSHVNIVIPDNATWEDAFQFGETTDTSWTLTGQKFRLDVKGDKEDAAALLSITSDAGEIVVDDVDARIIHMLVPEATIQAALIPGEYVYDLIMYNTDVPAVRVMLMHGCLTVERGITGG